MTPPADAVLGQGVAALRSTGSGQPPSGACLGVAVAGTTLTASAGHARNGPSLTDRTALTSTSAVDLGSVTKVVATTSAIAALVDAGDVALSTRLASLLPAAAGHGVADASLADLLEHRAGLRAWWPLYLTASSPSQALAQAVSLPLRHPPGTARLYSDLGFVLLGACVATIAGVPLDAAVERLVLRPVGLAATTWRAPAPWLTVTASSRGDRIEREMVATGTPYPVSDAARRAGEGFGWREHLLVGEVNDGNAFHAFGGAAGHAGLFSTVEDLLLAGRGWLASLRGEGVLSEATMRRFLHPGDDPGQALGFRRWVDVLGPCGAEAFGHTGFPGVAVAVLPAHDAAVAMATNRLDVDGPPRPGEHLWRAALGAAHRSLHTGDDLETSWTSP